MCVILLTCVMATSAFAGTSKPPKANPHNVSKSQYNFEGRAAWNTLYTNKQLTGKTSYTIYCKNRGAIMPVNVPTLTVRVYKYNSVLPDKILATKTIKKNNSGTITVKGLSKTDQIYVVFYAPCDFKGYIQ